jgi:hypothetical protein
MTGGLSREKLEDGFAKNGRLKRRDLLLGGSSLLADRDPVRRLRRQGAQLPADCAGLELYRAPLSQRPNCVIHAYIIFT